MICYQNFQTFTKIDTKSVNSLRVTEIQRQTIYWVVGMCVLDTPSLQTSTKCFLMGGLGYYLWVEEKKIILVESTNSNSHAASLLE